MTNYSTPPAVLAFPWRPTPDRMRAYETIRPRIEGMYPFVQVLEGDSGHERFRRGATRNLLVRRSESLQADAVVVLCDADSLPERQPLIDAIIGASKDDKIHYPFHEAWYMEQKVYARIEADQPLELMRSRIIDKCPSQGGCWVMKPSTWWKSGGMDDRLQGWGCEDRAFISASNTMTGQPVHHHGILLCLPHDRERNTKEAWEPGDVKILMEYHERYNDPERMRRYLESRSNDTSPFEESTEASSSVAVNI